MQVFGKPGTAALLRSAPVKTEPLVKRIACAVGVAALAVIGALPALAETRTAAVGDDSGTPFSASCDAGEALVGFAYNSEHMLLAVGALCRPYADGAIGGPVQKVKSVYGIEGGAGNDPVLCPEDRPVVTGLLVSLSSTLRVHSLRTTCRVPGADKKPILLKATNTSEGEAAGKKSVECPRGSYATGLFGTYGGGILSLGLECFEAGTDDAGVADGDNDADQGQFSVDFDVDLPDGQTGGNRQANEATTIYARPAGKEIAYLERGETVTIKGCEDGPHSWCEITEPTAGWVWGGDFR